LLIGQPPFLPESPETEEIQQSGREHKGQEEQGYDTVAGPQPEDVAGSSERGSTIRNPNGSTPQP